MVRNASRDLCSNHRRQLCLAHLCYALCIFSLLRCELRPEWQPPIEVYRVQKTCAPTVVPPLTRTHYVAGTPPERRFNLGR